MALRVKIHSPQHDHLEVEGFQVECAVKDLRPRPWKAIGSQGRYHLTMNWYKAVSYIFNGLSFVLSSQQGEKKLETIFCQVQMGPILPMPPPPFYLKLCSHYCFICSVCNQATDSK